MATASRTGYEGVNAHRSDRRDADRELFRRLGDRRDPVDREILVERFLPLARSLAARYVRTDEPFEDVFQVACLGLINAIDRYDVSRGQAFSSFAVPTITGEIKRYYRDRTWSVHVPRDLQDLTLKVDQVRKELESRLGRNPTVGEMARQLEVTEEEIVEAVNARHAMRAGSLDAPVAREDGTDTTISLLGDIDQGFARVERRMELEDLARVLRPRERMIVRLRFEHDMTQQEIGDVVGLSQMQVSRVLRAALERLRAHGARHSLRTNRHTLAAA